MANKIPTLIIGIGGIGGRITATLVKNLSEEDKKTVATICIDTNINDLKKLKDSGITETIQSSSADQVGTYVEKVERLYPEINGWFHRNATIYDKSLLEGAGQIRQLSRLSMLSCIERNEFDKFKRAIHTIRAEVTEYEESMKVFIVGSIAGGTGAGLMLQLPFFLREKVFRETNKDKVLIRGVFIGPSITKEKQNHNDTKEGSTFANAYACVKEVNAFNTFAFWDKDQIPVKIEYYNPQREEGDFHPNPIPYDFLFLIDQYNYSGHPLTENPTLENYIDMAAEMLRAQLSSVGADDFSAEDNLILDQIAQGGRNRFCGAGAIRALYPVESLSNYCAVRWAKESISTKWLFLDDQYAIQKESDLERLAVDPSYVPKTKEEFFTELFEELSGSTDKFFKTLGAEMFAPEVRASQENGASGLIGLPQVEMEEKLDRYTDLWDEINRYFDAMVEKSDLRNKREACTVTVDNVVNAFENDQMNFAEEIVVKLNNYSAAVQKNQSQGYSIANSILPGDMSTMSIGDRHNVLLAINTLHPIVARHILFKLWIDLTADYAELKKDERELRKTLDYFKTVDFDEEKPNVQGPQETFASLAHDQKSTGLLGKIGFGNKKNEVQEFAEKFVLTVGEQVRRLRDYNRIALKKTVFEEIIGKLQSMLEVYQVFFDNLFEPVSELDKIIIKEENKHKRGNEVVDRFVFARPECKKVAYEMVKSGFEESMLPDSAKRSFSEEIFKQYVELHTRVNQKKDISKEERELLKSEINQQVMLIFDTELLASMKKEMNIAATKKLDIGVIRALEYELLLVSELDKVKKEAEESGIGVDRGSENIAHIQFMNLINQKNYNQEALENAFASEIKKVISRATPYIRINGRPTDEAIYWGVNKDLFDSAGQGSIKERLDVEPTLKPSIVKDGEEMELDIMLPDNDFSRNELLCYRVVHNILPEELLLYDEGSEAKENYDDRVEAMHREAESVVTKKETNWEEKAISPHLDKRWHYEAYLPALNPETESAERFDDYLALVGLLGMDPESAIAIREEYGRKRWSYLYDVETPYDIHCGETLAAANYYDLFRSMSYNTIIKRAIIRRIERAIDDDIRGTVDIESELLEHRVIKALFRIQDIIKADGTTMTALDLLKMLSSKISVERYNATILGLKRFVWRYCGRACHGEQRDYLYDKLMSGLMTASTEEVREDIAFRNFGNVPKD